jgi:hypothetical protein
LKPTHMPNMVPTSRERSSRRMKRIAFVPIVVLLGAAGPVCGLDLMAAGGE